MADQPTINNHAALIWSVADLLRGDYKQSEYGKVILSLTVIRRLDCVGSIISHGASRIQIP
jgi:type I restriction enzyme M protein